MTPPPDRLTHRQDTQRLWPHVRAVRLAQRGSDCKDLLRLPLSPLAPDPHLSQPPGLPADTHTGPGTPGKACGKLGCAPVRAPPSVSGLRGVAGLLWSTSAHHGQAALLARASEALCGHKLRVRLPTAYLFHVGVEGHRHVQQDLPLLHAPHEVLYAVFELMGGLINLLRVTFPSLSQLLRGLQQLVRVGVRVLRERTPREARGEKDARGPGGDRGTLRPSLSAAPGHSRTPAEQA